MTRSPDDAAFKLRVQAEAMEAAAVIAERKGRVTGHGDRLRAAAADLRRPAFRIEETGW